MPQATIEYGNPFIRRLLDSDTEPERDRIVDEFAMAVAEDSDEERNAAERELVRFLRDNRTDRRHNLQRSYVPILLGKLGSDGAYRALVDRLPEEENDVVLKWLVKVLVRDFDRPERIEAIAATFDAERDGIIFARQVIARTLADHATDRSLGDIAIRVLMDAVCDRYAEVRRPAIRGIGRARASQAVPRLTRLLRGREPCPDRAGEAATAREEPSDAEMREIVEALAAIGDAAAIDALLEVLEDPGQAAIVLVAAADALARLGETAPAAPRDRIAGALVACQLHPDRAAAAAATAALRDLLSAENAAVRLAQHGLECTEDDIPRIANAIRLIDPEPAIRYLEGIDGDRRDRARLLITEIGGRQAFKLLTGATIETGAAWLMDGVAFLLVALPLGALVWSLVGDLLQGDGMSDTAIMSLLSFPLLVFVASVIVAFPTRRRIEPVRYLSSILLAFMFTAGMVATISGGLWRLNECDGRVAARTGAAPDSVAVGPEEGRAGDDMLCSGLDGPDFAAAIGPITVLRHSYTASEGGSAAWIVSLSRPPGDVAASGATTADDRLGLSGFGAPLWVLMLAVLGSGFLTVALIVQEISAEPDFGDQQDMRRRLGGILQHQFFVLFAPFGAIFVYQGLVEMGAAGKPLTVALAALGAGASLNLLLNRAVKIMNRAVRTDGADPGEPGPPSLGTDGGSGAAPAAARARTPEPSREPEA